MPEDVEGGVTEFEDQVISFFCDGVRLLGLPRSIGEIYGLLYVTESPLSLDDLVARLDISKGSVSQGLRQLRQIGAVIETTGPQARRVYYEPNIELKQLVSGFIKEQVRPHLASGETKLTGLRDQFELLTDHLPSEQVDFYEMRLSRLGRWTSRARLVLPVLQKLLGK